MTTEARPSIEVQEYNPNRKWESISGPAVGGDRRIVFHCEKTGEYAEVAAMWDDGRFVLFGNAKGRGIEYYKLTGPTGIEFEYERFNGKIYAPREFHGHDA